MALLLVMLLVVVGAAYAAEPRPRGAATPGSAEPRPFAHVDPARVPHWVTPGPRPSRAFGSPSHGRLVDGIQLPAAGPGFVTASASSHLSPNAPWRRWGTDRLVALVRRIALAYAHAHPKAAPLVIGDMSRPQGGPFGVGEGKAGHASHQNGRDVDIYYPRKDSRAAPPARVAQIDHGLSQDLLDRFVRAGAQLVFVGPNTGLRGPRGVVEVLRNHDNHMHVRVPWTD